MNSQDHFSAIAKEYAKGRITYPAELYAFLAQQCAARNVAWDCATGNGQAAHDLSRHFKRVIATDISKELLAAANPHPAIAFKEAAAEKSGLTAGSVDLVTVAQAIHWFDLEAFWEEIKRVLSAKGIVAFWGYKWPIVNADIDFVLKDFRNSIQPNWPEKSRLLHGSYSEINPPFHQIQSPEINIEVDWSLEDYMAHLRSWSGTRYHKEQSSKDLTLEFEERFRKKWSGDVKKVHWPLVLKVYKK